MIDFKLMKHQSDAIFKASIQPNLFLAFEVGTGKTCTTIQIIRNKCSDSNKLLKTLILAPKVVLNNWKNEFSLFSSIDSKNITVLTGALKNRIEFIENLKDFSKIVITNYDALVNDGFVRALYNWGPEILVCDESHYLKSYRSKRSKNVEFISSKCKHRYLLSGTPVLNNAMDLFQQFAILDQGKTFGKNFFAFRHEYFMDANNAWSHRQGYFPKFVPKRDTHEKITNKISQVVLKATKKECLDLPELVTMKLEVELGPTQEKAYNDMKKYFVAYVNDECTIAQQAVTKALRLQQIVSGFIKTDEGTVTRFSNVPRVDALKDQLEILTPNHKVIVWACFKENYAMIADVCKELGIKYVELHGETPDKERTEGLHAFENDPETRVLIGNQGAGGIGVNLVSASYAIWYSRGFKLGDDIQSRGRNHRRGSEQHEKITHINLVATNTIDEMISDVLTDKLEISNEILNFVRKGKYGF